MIINLDEILPEKVWKSMGKIFFIREIKCLFFLKVKHVTEYTKAKVRKSYVSL